MKFSSFADFIEQTKTQDREFLPSDELYKIPESINALANSSGGWIIAGVELDSHDNIIICGLNEDVKIAGLGSQAFDSPSLIKVFRVEPLTYKNKPATLNNQVYRRVEGINLASSKIARALMTRDSLEISRDDFPVNDSLDDTCVNEFRNAVTRLNADYKSLSQHEFLRRSFVYSGKHLTFAGALMFGTRLKIRAELKHTKTISLEAANIWRAYTKILPRLTARLSSSCARAFREIFINALVHSDYNIDNCININIIAGPPRVIIDNPGIIRHTARNLRIQKMFALAGIKTNGLDSVRLYAPSFTLQQDMLDFRAIASLKLEGNRAIIL